MDARSGIVWGFTSSLCWVIKASERLIESRPRSLDVGRVIRAILSTKDRHRGWTLALWAAIGRTATTEEEGRQETKLLFIILGKVRRDGGTAQTVK